MLVEVVDIQRYSDRVMKANGVMFGSYFLAIALKLGDVQLRRRNFMNSLTDLLQI